MAGEMIRPLTAAGMVSVEHTLAADAAMGDLVKLGHHYGFLLTDGKAGSKATVCVECNLVQWTVDTSVGPFDKKLEAGYEVHIDSDGKFRNVTSSKNPRTSDFKIGLVHDDFDPADAVAGKANIYLVWRSDR